MKFNKLIIPKYLLWLVLFVIATVYVQSDDRLSIFQGLLYFAMGCADVWLLLFISAPSIERFWRIYPKMEKLLLLLLGINFVTEMFFKQHSFWIGNLLLLCGYAFCPVWMRYRTHMRLRGMCLFFEKMSSEEKDVIIKNADKFLDGPIALGTMMSFDSQSMIFRINTIDFAELLKRPNLGDRIIKDFPTFMAIISSAMEKVCYFAIDRRAIVEEDKILYKDGVVEDAECVFRRNKLEGKKKSFISRWGIDPLVP